MKRLKSIFLSEIEEATHTNCRMPLLYYKAFHKYLYSVTNISDKCPDFVTNIFHICPCFVLYGKFSVDEVRTPKGKKFLLLNHPIFLASKTEEYVEWLELMQK